MSRREDEMTDMERSGACEAAILDWNQPSSSQPPGQATKDLLPGLEK